KAFLSPLRALLTAATSLADIFVGRQIALTKLLLFSRSMFRMIYKNKGLCIPLVASVYITRTRPKPQTEIARSRHFRAQFQLWFQQAS
ncbi:MAG: hypothetical protein II642_03785, partial [Firmicutes bacterium]|nr:hypothetical protein [Bacillota bacterium]